MPADQAPAQCLSALLNMAAQLSNNQEVAAAAAAYLAVKHLPLGLAAYQADERLPPEQAARHSAACQIPRGPTAQGPLMQAPGALQRVAAELSSAEGACYARAAGGKCTSKNVDGAVPAPVRHHEGCGQSAVTVGGQSKGDLQANLCMSSAASQPRSLDVTAVELELG